MSHRGRPRGDRDFSRDQFLAAHRAAVDIAGSEHRGRPTEVAIAGIIGIARSTLFRYRREYDVPRPSEKFIQSSATRRAPSRIASSRTPRRVRG
jgi:hypothetical protein